MTAPCGPTKYQSHRDFLPICPVFTGKIVGADTRDWCKTIQFNSWTLWKTRFVICSCNNHSAANTYTISFLASLPTPNMACRALWWLLPNFPGQSRRKSPPPASRQLPHTVQPYKSDVHTYTPYSNNCSYLSCQPFSCIYATSLRYACCAAPNRFLAIYYKLARWSNHNPKYLN